MANSLALVSVPPMPPAPVQGGSMVQSQMMQPGMMQPAMMQQMLMQQQMMMNPMMMQQQMPPPAPPGGKHPDAHLDPGAPKEVRKKHVEYQRLIKKGNNAETVFIGGLRKTTDEDQVAAHFAKFGQVEKVEIKRQPDGTSRGFAFVKFKDMGAVDKVIESRAKHMIDNKWIEVKRHNGVAACAGRAASLQKPEEPKEEEPDQEDLEDKWTQQYLTMAQQYGKMSEDHDDEDHPQQQAQQPMMAMQPMMMPMPMMAMPTNMPMASGGAPPKDGNIGGSPELMVTGFMTVDANVLGIRGGPPGMMVGVPMLSNGQPAVNIPGFNPGMMNNAPGGCSGVPPGQGMTTAPAQSGCGGPVIGGPVAGAPLALPPGPPPPPVAPPGPGCFQAVRPGGPGMARPGPYQT